MQSSIDFFILFCSFKHFYIYTFCVFLELCLKDNIGIADSLFNLRQIGEFCRNHLPWKAFHLTYEDLLYTHESMKVNILTFLADLFYCFEGPGSPESEASSAAAALTAAKEKIDGK